MARTEKVELTVLCLVHNGDTYLLQNRKKRIGKDILCGVKQFPIEGGRYIVFLFSADQYEGALISSEEGTMHWIPKKELTNINLVNDFHELLRVILEENLNELNFNM